MASDKFEVSNFGIIIILLLGWFWWSRNKAGGTMGLGSGAAGGCGCHASIDGPPVVSSSTNANGTQSLVSSITPSGLAGSVPVVAGGNAPGNTPGSRWRGRAGAGSGAQWSGLRRTAFGLTPGDVPNSPSSPTGSGIWVGNTTVTKVAS